MFAVRSLWLVALVGCEGPYVLGEESLPPAAYCPMGIDCRGRLEVTFGTAGTGAWGDRFDAGHLSRAFALLLRGEDASAEAWAPRTGGKLVPDGAVAIGRRGPFTDATRAARGSFTSSEPVLELGPGDLALELVVRAHAGATVLDVPTAALSLHADAGGALVLTLDGTAISTEKLVENAWYHVMFVVRPGGSRVYVNGVASDGPGATLAGTDTHAIAVGGELAWLAIVPLGAGELQIREARERFARLVGVAASLAGGDPIPTTIARNGAAFTDLVEAGARKMHLVGPNWPRLACRPAASIVCGFLIEGGGGRQVPLDLSQWMLVAGAVAPAVPSLSDIVPTVSATGAMLSTDGPGGSRRVLSVFARGAGSVVVGIDQVGHVRCSPAAGTADVVDSAVALEASLEPWGDGWVRCGFTTEDAPDAGTSITLEADAVELAGPQIEGNKIARGSLVLAGQGADALVYDTGDNIPAASSVQLRVRVLTDGKSIHDRSVLGLNALGSDGMPSRANDADLYLLTRDGPAHFGASVNDVLAWNVGTDAHLAGTEATIHATWTPAQVTLSDGIQTATAETDLVVDASVFAQVRVGSSAASGELDGVVGDFSIGP